MVKRIIVNLNNLEYSKDLLELALTMAQKNNGEVLGTISLNIQKIAKAVGPVPLGGMYYAEKVIELKLKEARGNAENSLKEFQEYFDLRQVKNKGLLLEGNPYEDLVELGKTADVVITRLQSYKLARRTDDKLQRLIRSATCPVIALPEHNQPFKDVLIAYEGSAIAAMAMKSFAQLSGFLPSINRLVLMNINDDVDYGRELLAPVSDYLEVYGLSPEICVSSGEPKELIIKKAAELDAPLVVLGSFGESKIADMVWGSTTSYFIENGAYSLLIHH